MEGEMSMPGRKVPKTDSINELARFWDSHDLTDFEHDLVVVNEPVFERQSVLNVCLQQRELEAVKKLAESKGVGDSDLIREWVLEKLRAS